jgi:hypothetical protein
MNRQSIVGLICGLLIATPLFYVAAKSIVTNDTDQGVVYCKVRDSMPECDKKIPVGLLTGYSIPVKDINDNPKDGDPLVCRLTQHNAWYFTWDRRGHGWFNNMTYSYNCKVGQGV